MARTQTRRVLPRKTRSRRFLQRGEREIIMFCNSCNNSCLWLIIILIILFAGGGSWGCGCDNNNNGCGCNCGCN